MQPEPTVHKGSNWRYKYHTGTDHIICPWETLDMLYLWESNPGVIGFTFYYAADWGGF